MDLLRTRVNSAIVSAQFGWGYDTFLSFAFCYDYVIPSHFGVQNISTVSPQIVRYSYSGNSL